MTFRRTSRRLVFILFVLPSANAAAIRDVVMLSLEGGPRVAPKRVPFTNRSASHSPTRRVGFKVVGCRFQFF